MSMGYRLRHWGTQVDVLVLDPRAAELHALMPEKKAADTSKFLLSPMPGLLVTVNGQRGQAIKAGQELAVIEAMKMENVLCAERDGIIAVVHAHPWDNLAVDQPILEFEEAGPGSPPTDRPHPAARAMTEETAIGVHIRRVRVRGRVQGVWFRGWIIEEATARGLDGWVRNCLDGTVEAVFCGPADKVSDMVSACRQGPPAAVVTAVESRTENQPPKSGFRSRPTQ